MKLRRRQFNLLGLGALLAGGRPAAAPTVEAPAAVLAAVARTLFPHDFVEAGRYRGIAEAFLASQPGPAGRLAVAAGGGRFPAWDPERRVAVLQPLENTPDFLAFRFHVMMNLYNDLSLTRHFGYEGPSLDRGGYLHRGFGAIDWLPGPDSGSG
ncbi:MAG: hypothetical protein ACX93N_03885 [Pseudohaliea sp.]